MSGWGHATAARSAQRDQRAAEAVARRSAGDEIDEIATDMAVSLASVNRWLRAAGVSRPRGGGCRVCRNRRMLDIEDAIRRLDTYRAIAEEYGLGVGSVKNHACVCMGLSRQDLTLASGGLVRKVHGPAEPKAARSDRGSLRGCTACRSGDRVAIDAALLALESASVIASRTSVSQDAIAYHRNHCLAMRGLAYVIRCTICARPDHDEIDRLLRHGIPRNRIEDAYGLTRSALRNHHKHMDDDNYARRIAEIEVARLDKVRSFAVGEVAS